MSISTPNTYPCRIAKVIKDLDCLDDFLEITSLERKKKESFSTWWTQKVQNNMKITGKLGRS